VTFQTGEIGPLAYEQSNSGVATDTDTNLSYTPQQFGAPIGAQIIAGTVAQGYSVTRGLAYVHNLSIRPAEISFSVYTQAADNGIFGHHSGDITVTTAFRWYID
jgi:hypothetical protein